MLARWGCRSKYNSAVEPSEDMKLNPLDEEQMV